MLIECPEPVRNGGNIIDLIVNDAVPPNPDFTLPFKEDIKYFLFPSKNKIYVKTSNIQFLYSSLFNIPMSVFALFKKKVIVHCNAVEYKNSLYCFSAKKGVGKTTLALFLNEYCDIFSDDCVAFDSKDDNNSIFGFRSSQKIKLCRDTYDVVINDCHYNDYYDELSGKATLTLDIHQYKEMPIRKLFFLTRGNTNQFSCKEINNILTKKVLLIQSIVGKEYIPNELINTFVLTELFTDIISRIPFYIVKIPHIKSYDSQIEAFWRDVID